MGGYIIESGQAGALVISEKAFDRAFEVICDYGPESGPSLREILLEAFLAAGAEFPLPVFVKYARGVGDKLSQPRYQRVEVRDGNVHLPLIAPFPWYGEAEAFGCPA